MNLEPNSEQKLLAQSVTSVLAGKYVPGFRAAAAASELGWSAEVFTELAEVGITALNIAEESGGVGGGATDVYVAMESLGQFAAVEPLLDGVFLPAWVLADAGAPERLASVAEGEAVIAVAHAEPKRAWDGAPTVEARTESGITTVTGVKSPVHHADNARLLVVTAVDVDGVFGLYLVDSDADGITRVDGRTTDWSHASDVTFAATPATVVATGPDARQAFDVSIAKARIALTGEAIGLMETGLAQTVEYLRSRKQFGVPLSTFQALTHRAADLYAEIELARSMALWATAKAEEFDTDSTVEIESVADDAFAFVAGAARLVAEEIVQLHGGIGMTFESPVSHVAARLTGITQAFGGVAAARRRALARPTATTTPSAA
ncbi:acyl-CoA dehydrogenase family protein [Antrihabitans cavernicola]|uniref:Acyl-CoA dehydrogenase n=1 Tax=Antrihabitans cavernicola TaxID=2495913 RepID=A0A5A7SDA4_9NOCA|nr:acyl-CoA dehydrogenase family protein [Spelaeibacter cavernicola]KAA0023359.1 acyl-CoA dehydrogenase [Spelaeibacter cavernicola]